MFLSSRWLLLTIILGFFCLVGQAMAESTFDRELVVKDKSRAAAVENVLRELLRSYENEDAREFLDRVSEDRFRQDYLLFTDALYNDFRTYEIHRVDYWVDRVVADNVKQFIYVRWEKRYETLADARQLTATGLSRFLFDEVNGKYLLIELAGNDLFGASLPDWTAETPAIPGQENQATTAATSNSVSSPAALLPDLSVQSATFDFATYTFTAVVANYGDGASGANSILVNGMSGSSPNTTSYAIPALAAGATYAINDTSFFGFDSVSLVTVDPTNIVTESNETNNTRVP